MARPIIGVTGPDEGGLAAWWFTRLALRRAGARVVRITPARGGDIDALDGLVIGGGADVDPALYGQERVHLEELGREGREFGRWLLTLLLFPLIYLLRRALSTMTSRPGGDRARDELETSLVQAALQRDLPVLGICRGAQLLNVVAGGSLHQSLSDFYVESPQLHTVWPHKRIRLEAGSRLAGILGCERCRVNSLHNQAVDTLAPGLRVAAREESGVVQAIEHPTLAFAIGVQWHPEYLPQRREQQRLFRRLVETAGKSDRQPTK